MKKIFSREAMRGEVCVYGVCVCVCVLCVYVCVCRGVVDIEQG